MHIIVTNLSQVVFNRLCDTSRPYIDVNIETLIGADFCCATILITFGVIIGVASPLQLIVMTMIEVVIFNVNEVIGRQYIGTRDAGDTIFVHMFGAYFGLAISRILYDQATVESKNPGGDKHSNLFSMVNILHFKTIRFITIIMFRLEQFSCGFTGQVSMEEQQPLEMDNRELSSTPTCHSVPVLPLYSLSLLLSTPSVSL